MRSLIVTRCGEMNVQVLCPASLRTASRKQVTLPFPFVPATCAMRSPRSGEPSTFSHCLVVSGVFFTVNFGMPLI